MPNSQTQASYRFQGEQMTIGSQIHCIIHQIHFNSAKENSTTDTSENNDLLQQSAYKIYLKAQRLQDDARQSITSIEQLSQGLKHITQAIQMRGNRHDYLIFGLVLQHLQRNDEALTAYETSITVEPDQDPLLEVFINKGLISEKSIKHQQALMFYESAIRVQPHNHLGYGCKAKALMILKENQRALKYCQQAIFLNLKQNELLQEPLYHFRRGMVYENLSNFEKDIEDQGYQKPNLEMVALNKTKSGIYKKQSQNDYKTASSMIHKRQYGTIKAEEIKIAFKYFWDPIQDITDALMKQIGYLESNNRNDVSCLNEQLERIIANKVKLENIILKKIDIEEKNYETLNSHKLMQMYNTVDKLHDIIKGKKLMVKNLREMANQIEQILASIVKFGFAALITKFEFQQAILFKKG